MVRCSTALIFVLFLWGIADIASAGENGKLAASQYGYVGNLASEPMEAATEEQPRVLHRMFEETDTTLNATYSAGLGRIATDSLKALGISLAFVVVIFLDTCCISRTKGNNQAGNTGSLSSMRQPLLEDLEMIELGLAPTAPPAAATTTAAAAAVAAKPPQPPQPQPAVVAEKRQEIAPPPPQPAPPQAKAQNDEIDDLFI